VPLRDTEELLKVIAEAGLSSREGCGNTVRNVTGDPWAGVATDENPGRDKKDTCKRRKKHSVDMGNAHQRKLKYHQAYPVLIGLDLQILIYILCIYNICIIVHQLIYL